MFREYRVNDDDSSAPLSTELWHRSPCFSRVTPFTSDFLTNTSLPCNNRCHHVEPPFYNIQALSSLTTESHRQLCVASDMISAPALILPPHGSSRHSPDTRRTAMPALHGLFLPPAMPFLIFQTETLWIPEFILFNPYMCYKYSIGAQELFELN